MIEIDGKLGFCCLTPTIDKTFHIMGLAQYAPIFDTEERAVAELGEHRG
jgi:anti-anti-sigma regulatory factor